MSELTPRALLGLLKQARAEADLDPDPHPDDEVDSDEYVGLSSDAVLAATEKLLAVNRGVEDPDERDMLPNDRFVTPDAMLEEYIRLDNGGAAKKLMRIVAAKKSLQGIPPFWFDDYGHRLIVGNPLSSPIEEVNPLSIAEQARRVTKFGPGGIGDEMAVTSDMQALHPSQVGFLSIIEGPESSRLGLDTRLAMGAKFGTDRRLYQRFYDRRRGAHVWMSPEDVWGKTMKLPD